MQSVSHVSLVNSESGVKQKRIAPCSKSFMEMNLPHTSHRFQGFSFIFLSCARKIKPGRMGVHATGAVFTPA